ncbi:hypothetical protein ACTJJ7_24305 [Phyllobacterium sp. 22229]|jgi:hypothetical protein|nr:hypothetical protein [Phyllobacterium myrsinacearum]PWV83919.1 hypothetical protein DEV92_11920 [Phyllobacterium myrsinacearum]RZU97013.1 hypothetical protein EV654_5002 [Phyllobacterium myrsinacearum]
MIRLSANAHIAVTVSAVDLSGTSVLMLNEQMIHLRIKREQ